MLTKEGAFLAIAVFLVYLDLHLAAQLAGRTLQNWSARAYRRELTAIMATRGLEDGDPTLEAEGRKLTNLDVPWRRAALTLGLAPFAWIVAALWPFLGALKDRFDWGEEVPRPGDLLILLGTFTLPLLTPVISTTIVSSTSSTASCTAVRATDRLVLPAGMVIVVPLGV